MCSGLTSWGQLEGTDNKTDKQKDNSTDTLNYYETKKNSTDTQNYNVTKDRQTTNIIGGVSGSPGEGSCNRKLELLKLKNSTSGVGSRSALQDGGSPKLNPKIKKGTSMWDQLSETGIDHENQIKLGRLGEEQDFKSKEFTDGELALQEGVRLDQGSPEPMYLAFTISNAGKFKGKGAEKLIVFEHDSGADRTIVSKRTAIALGLELRQFPKTKTSGSGWSNSMWAIQHS
jgi:hypothetical protein